MTDRFLTIKEGDEGAVERRGRGVSTFEHGARAAVMCACVRRQCFSTGTRKARWVCPGVQKIRGGVKGPISPELVEKEG